MDTLIEEAKVAVVEEVVPGDQFDEGILEQLRIATALHREAKAGEHRLDVGVPEAA
jgi:hypothetical protein